MRKLKLRELNFDYPVGLLDHVHFPSNLSPTPAALQPRGQGRIDEQHHGQQLSAVREE